MMRQILVEDPLQLKFALLRDPGRRRSDRGVIAERPEQQGVIGAAVAGAGGKQDLPQPRSAARRGLSGSSRR
jgi:hypothetical protein